jgi:hypothetical protein
MNTEYGSALEFERIFEDVISRFDALSPGLALDNPGEKLVVAICDALKARRQTDDGDKDAWLALSKEVGRLFADLVKEGRDWQALASLVVQENRRLFASDPDFYRAIQYGADILPTEVYLYMEMLSKKLK